MPSPLAGEGGSRSEPGEGFFLAFPDKIQPKHTGYIPSESRASTATGL